MKINAILDFGDLHVFDEATTYPCILSVTKTQPAGIFKAAYIQTLDFPQGLEKHVKEIKSEVLIAELQDEGWTLSDASVQRLLAKLRKTGTPLGKYVKGKIYRGVLTGLNEAFVIDEATKNRLIAEDPACTEIIKPFLAGRDIKQYRQPQSNKYLILLKNGDTQKWFGKLDEPEAWEKLKEKYPAVASHLIQFEEKAKKRYDKGQYWWELRACDYYEEFEKPKVMLPDISTHCQALIDLDNNFYCVNTAYIIPNLSFSDLAILNSKLVHFFYSNLTQSIRGGYLRFIRQYLEQIPIIKTKNLDEKVAQIIALKKENPEADTTALEAEIDQMVYALYGLTEEEVKVVESGGAV